MTWTKIDDRFASHPKVQQAWHACPSSIGLYVFSLSHSAAYLLDGRVPLEFVKTCIAGAAGRKRAVAALVDAGLWEQDGCAWRIHDYLDFNESRAEIAERRAAESARKAAGIRPESGRPRVGARATDARGPFPDLLRSLNGHE